MSSAGLSCVLSNLRECSLNPMRKALRNITSDKLNLIYVRKFSFSLMVTLYISPKSVFATFFKKVQGIVLEAKIPLV